MPISQSSNVCVYINRCIHTYVYKRVYIYIYIYMYVYIYIERERERDYVCVYSFLHIYISAIYMYKKQCIQVCIYTYVKQLCFYIYIYTCAYAYTPGSRCICVTQLLVSRTTTPEPKSQNMLPKYTIRRSTRKD